MNEPKMTPAEALQLLLGHSRAAVCTLTPQECAALAAALKPLVHPEPEKTP